MNINNRRLSKEAFEIENEMLSQISDETFREMTLFISFACLIKLMVVHDEIEFEFLKGCEISDSSLTYFDILSRFNDAYPEMCKIPIYLGSDFIYKNQLNVLWMKLYKFYKFNLYRFTGCLRNEIIELFEELVEYHKRNTRVSPDSDKTPSLVCKLLSSLVGVQEKYKVCDLWCRNGEILIEATKDIADVRIRGWSNKINENELSIMLAVISGCDDFHIENKNILFENALSIDNEFDVVLSNPPFSIPFNKYDIDSELTIWGKPPERYSDFLFLAKALQMLNDNGRAAIVVSTSVLDRSGAEKKIRENLSKSGFIKTIIRLPKKIFTGTPVSTAVILLDKKNDSETIRMIDATQTTNNFRHQFDEDSVEWIMTKVKSSETSAVVSDVNLDELKDKKYSWDPNSYFASNDVIFDINVIQNEVDELESQLKNLGVKYHELRKLTGVKL